MIPVTRPRIVVFGASGVLGSALCGAFHSVGEKVVGTGFKKAPLRCASSLQLDLADSKSLPELEQWLKSDSWMLDTAIFAVGSTRDGLLVKTSDDDWREVIGSNLKSAFLVARALLPIFVKRKGGQFIFVSSFGGRTGRAGQSNYAAAKAGLHGFVQSLAREYASRGIRANLVIPGVFESPMTGAMTQDSLSKLRKDDLLGQASDPSRIANWIVEFSRHEGITGQIFQLDGRIAG
jgi:3-oxoacyl-[acyl-carrier protein] reductase